jgi:GT2 family glycosyltransferase
VANLTSPTLVEEIRASISGVNIIEISIPQNHSENSNCCFKNARSEYFLILNDDTYFEEDVLDRLVEFMDRNPDVGCVYPMLRYPDGRIQRGTHSKGTLLTFVLVQLGIIGILNRLADFLYRPMPRTIIDTIGCTGACCLIRRETWQKLKGFDEAIGVAPNDKDLGRRIKAKGYRVCYFPFVSVVHLGSASMKEDNARSLLMLMKSTSTYYQKYYGIVGKTAVGFMMLLGCIIRCVACLSIGVFNISTNRRNLYFQRAHKYMSDARTLIDLKSS